MSYCCNQMKNGCEQGRLCPLREAAKRGFWPPPEKKPEPPKPESKAHFYWLIALIAVTLAAVIADGAGAPISVPFK